ncbi:MAG: hypothetical protein ABSF36_03570 [Candidatus Methanomethylicaceae archaeon]
MNETQRKQKLLLLIPLLLLVGTVAAALVWHSNSFNVLQSQFTLLGGPQDINTMYVGDTGQCNITLIANGNYGGGGHLQMSLPPATASFGLVSVTLDGQAEGGVSMDGSGLANIPVMNGGQVLTYIISFTPTSAGNGCQLTATVNP